MWPFYGLKLASSAAVDRNMLLSINKQIIVLDRKSVNVSVSLLFFFWRNSPPPPLGQVLLIHEVSRTHTTTQHSRKDCSGRVISSSHRPQQITRATDKHPCPPVEFEPTILEAELQQTYALDRAANGTGEYLSVLML